MTKNTNERTNERWWRWSWSSENIKYIKKKEATWTWRVMLYLLRLFLSLSLSLFDFVWCISQHTTSIHPRYNDTSRHFYSLHIVVVVVFLFYFPFQQLHKITQKRVITSSFEFDRCLNPNRFFLGLVGEDRS